MSVYTSKLDVLSEQYQQNYKESSEMVQQLRERLAAARSDGSAKAQARYRKRGKLLPSERVRVCLNMIERFDAIDKRFNGTDLTFCQNLCYT